MKRVLKIGLGLGVVAVGAYFLTSYVRQISDKFGFELTGFGIPAIKGTKVVIPVVVKFNNPASLPINADNVHIDIFLYKNQWTLVATIDQPMTLEAGESQQKINVEVDLKAVLGGNVIDTIQSVFNTYNNKTLPLHAEVSVTYQGVTLPMQTFDENLSLT